MAEARAAGSGASRAGSRGASPTTGVEGEIYVTAPGAEIEEDHPLVAAIDEATTRCSAPPPSGT